jgi:hypothetical protein
MDLDGIHQKDLFVTKSVISGCPTMCNKTAIYFLLALFYAGTFLKCLVYLVVIVIIYFRLINHKNGIKAHFFPHSLTNISTMQDGKVETDDSGTFSHLKKST